MYRTVSKGKQQASMQASNAKARAKRAARIDVTAHTPRFRFVRYYHNQKKKLIIIFAAIKTEPQNASPCFTHTQKKESKKERNISKMSTTNDSVVPPPNNNKKRDNNASDDVYDRQIRLWGKEAQVRL